MRLLLILFLTFGSSLGYSQKFSNYKSTYNIFISKEVKNNNNFSFGIETSQGFKILRYFVVSGTISFSKYTNFEKYFFPIKGEVKWYYNEVGEYFANPYLLINAGPNIRINDTFADGTSACIGIGVNFEIEDNIYNLCIFKSSQNTYLTNQSYELTSFGLNLGITF